MAGFSLNDFLSKVRSEDLARSNRFEVEIFGPGDAKAISILCEDASVPGLIVPYTPTKIGNWTEPRAHGIEFFGDNATFTFYCDSSWNVRDYFENWMFSCVNPISKEISFYNNTVGTAVIHALNRKDDIVKSWTLVDCLPRNISLTPLSHGNEGVARVSVSLAYKYWTPDSNGISASTVPINSAVSGVAGTPRGLRI